MSDVAKGARVAPRVMAALTERAPGRIVKKLDAEPRAAEAWTWSLEEGALSVTTDRGEVVRARLSGMVLEDAEAIECSCLLSPKCLHVLAVARALPLDEPSETSDAPSGDLPDESAPVTIALGESERAAAAHVFAAVAELLDAGAGGAGAVLQAEVLRAGHSARALGLHRVASAATRVVKGVRDLREQRPEASLDELTGELREALGAARALADREAAAPSLIGTARRPYAPIGSLRLYGLFTDAVATTSGYAGVVTYFCDAKGALYTVSDVMPGPPSRALASYDAGAKIGDVSLSHRALSREGLFLSDATASADGRLGAGAGVRAVRAGPSSLSDDAPRALFATPIEAQLERARRAMVRPPLERPAGWDLLFTTATVLGVTRDALIVAVPGEIEPLALRCVAPSDHEALHCRENLRRLGALAGSALDIIGRVRFGEHRTLSLLAVGAHEQGSLTLPTALGGRVNLALDLLRGADLPEGAVPTLLDGGEPALLDPLEPLRRRIQRMVLGGRGTLPPEANDAIEAEAARLVRLMLPSGAAMLRELSQAAQRHERTLTGERRRASPELLGAAWLRAATYLDAATVALRCETWL